MPSLTQRVSHASILALLFSGIVHDRAAAFRAASVHSCAQRHRRGPWGVRRQVVTADPEPEHKHDKTQQDQEGEGVAGGLLRTILDGVASHLPFTEEEEQTTELHPITAFAHSVGDSGSGSDSTPTPTTTPTPDTRARPPAPTHVHTELSSSPSSSSSSSSSTPSTSPPPPPPEAKERSPTPFRDRPSMARPSSIARRRKNLTQGIMESFEWLMERRWEAPLPEGKDSPADRELAPEELLKVIVDFRLGKDAPGSAVQDLFEVIKALPLNLKSPVKVIADEHLTELIQEKKEQQRRVMARPTPFHLHIGAGRLGLGLVVPAVSRSKTPLAILQRPSTAWSSVFPDGPKTIDIVVNDKAVCPDMVVVRDLKDLPPTPVGKTQPDLFVVTEDNALLTLLVSTATTYSMSLGPYMKDVIPLLEHLPIIEHAEDGEVNSEGLFRPVLYAAENDHAMVEEVAKALEGKVDVVTVMVDRICVERKVCARRVEVVAEPYEGEMVVIHHDDRPCIPPPFVGQSVRVPDLETHAEYFCRRKFLLVNGSHTTLAFLTLCLRQPRRKGPGGGHHVTEPEDHELINWDVSSCGEVLHKEIWAWAVARIMMLLTEFDTADLRAAHGVDTDEELVDDLFAYARETLTRFASTKDTTSRVLQGGVSNRWEGRLKSVDRFMETVDPERPIFQTVFNKAGVDLPYMRKVISRLCVDGKRFARAQQKAKA